MVIAPEFLWVTADTSGPEGLHLPSAVRAWRGARRQAEVAVAAV